MKPVLWRPKDWKESKQFLKLRSYNNHQGYIARITWALTSLQKSLLNIKFKVMNDNSKVLIGLLTGLAAGAALGLLFAPEKGSETRDRLSQSLKDLGETIKDRAADEINHLASLKEKVVSSVKNKLQDAEEEFADDVEHA
jgi:gas vesicle protein